MPNEGTALPHPPEPVPLPDGLAAEAWPRGYPDVTTDYYPCWEITTAVGPVSVYPTSGKSCLVVSDDALLGNRSFKISVALERNAEGEWMVALPSSAAGSGDFQHYGGAIRRTRRCSRLPRYPSEKQLEQAAAVVTAALISIRVWLNTNEIVLRHADGLRIVKRIRWIDNEIASHISGLHRLTEERSRVLGEANIRHGA